MRLAEMITEWRERNEYSLRQLAEEIGVSKTSLGRFEKGGNVDQGSFMKILLWLWAGNK